MRERFGLDLRTIGSAGEALGREAYEWAQDELGIAVNEFYGQTECNYRARRPAPRSASAAAGAIGKPVPGHEVAVIDAEGRRGARPASIGQIAVRRPDPVMFLGYWDQPEATREKFIGDWMTTGDQGVADEDGYVHFFGRDDDVITSAGYRIGPGEIEDCLDRPSGGRARRRGRQARPAAHRDRQGLCGAEGRCLRRLRSWRTRSSFGCASGCRRMNIRARSSSSIRCR